MGEKEGGGVRGEVWEEGMTYYSNKHYTPNPSPPPSDDKNTRLGNLLRFRLCGVTCCPLRFHHRGIKVLVRMPS